MIIVVLCGFEAAANSLQYMACCSWVRILGCANPLPNHFLEKIEPIDPKILPLLN